MIEFDWQVFNKYFPTEEYESLVIEFNDGIFIKDNEKLIAFISKEVWTLLSQN